MASTSHLSLSLSTIHTTSTTTTIHNSTLPLLPSLNSPLSFKRLSKKTPKHHLSLASASTPSEEPSPVLNPPTPNLTSPSPNINPNPNRGKRQAQSTDWVASSLSRRFGLGAGIAWVGVLAVGVVGEQIKTRREVYLEEQETRDVSEAKEITTEEGVRYSDLRIGGGSYPSRGDLVLVSLLGKAKDDEIPFVDTFSPGKKDLVYTFGIRPYIGGVCYGLEIAMKSMKVGGKRKVIVPSELGFGHDGADFGGIRVGSDAELEYVVDLKRSSIPPS